MFKKRREDRKKRSHDFKTPRANSYLIVTEGKRTEPLYFEGIRKRIKEKVGGNVDVVPVIDTSFEYWLYLHFEYSDSALHRHSWNQKLDDIFKKYNLGDGRYRKNYEGIFNMVDCFEGVKNAVSNAKRRMNGYCEGETKPSEYNPGTRVYLLVEELLKYLK